MGLTCVCEEYFVWNCWPERWPKKDDGMNVRVCKEEMVQKLLDVQHNVVTFMPHVHMRQFQPSLRKS